MRKGDHSDVMRGKSDHEVVETELDLHCRRKRFLARSYHR
jgi:hypothetical protein